MLRAHVNIMHAHAHVDERALLRASCVVSMSMHTSFDCGDAWLKISASTAFSKEIAGLLKKMMMMMKNIIKIVTELGLYTARDESKSCCFQGLAMRSRS